MVVLWCFVIGTLFVALVSLFVAVRNRLNLKALVKIVVDGLTVIDQAIDKANAAEKARQLQDDEPTNPGLNPQPRNLNKDLN